MAIRIPPPLWQSTRLKDVFESELHLPHVGGCSRDSREGRGSDGGIGIPRAQVRVAPLRVIQGIEGFIPQLQALAFRDGKPEFHAEECRAAELAG